MAKNKKLAKKQLVVVDIAGWYGMSAVLLAYTLVSLDILEPHNVWSLLLNLTGAIGIIAVSLVRRVRQLVVLNIVWALVAIFALIQVGFTR